MEKLGGVFDVHVKSSSLYSAPMFIPVMLGLVITKTPWWSGMVSFGLGVISVVTVSLFANVTQGLPADSFASLFLDIDLKFFGLDVTRYELQMITGIVKKLKSSTVHSKIKLRIRFVTHGKNGSGVACT